MPARSKFVVVGAWDPGSAARIDLFGGVDDHLRAIALLASAARGKPGADGDAARECLNPKVSWRTRLDAFRGALAGARMSVQVRDVDALYIGPHRAPRPDDEGDLEERWNDHAMRGQRKEFLSVLLDISASAPASSWTFLRTSRHPMVSSELRSRGVDSQPGLVSENPDSVEVSLTELDPIVRSIARRMVEAQIIGPNELRRMVQGTEKPELDVVEAAVDTLPSRARKTLRTLATSRSETTVNGTAGPFPWASVRPEAAASTIEAPRIRRADFDLLCSRGLVVCAERSWRVPRQVRSSVLRVARALDEDEVRSVHRWLTYALDKGSPDEAAERHHHAVEAEDIELATSTATMYSADLRALGYSLSRRASDTRSSSARWRLFRAAAEVFRRLVTDFDKGDAYAWEYYAFNLARAGGATDDVERAYQQACTLDPGNPLYRGRLVGYLAEHGRDVSSIFGKWLAVYREDWGNAGVQWFADPALRGARRCRGTSGFETLCDRYGPILRESPRLLRLMDVNG